MRFGQIFERLRLPHRILIVFFLCVLLPLIIMLSLSFSRLEYELKEQTFQRLRYQSKTTALSILGRLHNLENEMRFFISNNLSSLKDSGEHWDVKDPRYQMSHFEGIVHIGPHGAEKLLGNNLDLTSIQPHELKPSQSGKPIIIQRTASKEFPLLFMAIAISGSEWLIGQINTNYLWDQGNSFNLPPDTGLCIIGESNRVLVSTVAEPEKLIEASPIEGGRNNFSNFIWEDGKEAYFASAYRLFVESSFSSSSWKIVINCPQKSTLTAIRSFRTNLSLVGLLLVLMVLFLSLVSIRKSLEPLNRLVAATKALGRSDFSRKVDVCGSLEFQELSAAFNRMAEQIEKHFKDLRESEERFRAAFDDSAAGMALVSPEGHFLEVNQFLSTMFGYAQKELLSKNLNELIHPDQIEESKVISESLLDDKHGDRANEKRFLHEDGRILCGLVSKSLMKDGSDNPPYYILHVQDITALKEAQIESQKFEKQLMHAQKMEAVGTLAAGISHDFNNILSAIIGYTELGLMDVPEGTPLQNNLANVLKAGRRAADLVKQILAFSRRDEEKMAPIQLSSVVKEALKLLRSSIPPHISIVQNISSDPVYVNADPTQIHQLIMNLCTNAYHAMMSSETGTLEVSLSPERITTPGTNETARHIKLRVSDTGCGMPPEVRERIFEPYFTTKQKGVGTGLGLSIVHTIVEKHKGDIQVDSAPGRGTTFEIRFKAIEQEIDPKNQAVQKLPTGCENILIVDDEIDVASIWQQMLSRQGYQVESKNDPLDALNDFRKTPDRYNLVITDLAMPGMTGEILSEELSRIRPKIPVILCTGYFEETRNKSLCPAIKEYLIKPVNMITLAETVRKVIDQSGRITLNA
jgi:two-component system, cell cycle sensor histidine kinase and response regulator CckA